MTLARFQMKLKQMSISQTAFPRVYGKDKAIFSIIRSSLVVFLFKAAASSVLSKQSSNEADSVRQNNPGVHDK